MKKLLLILIFIAASIDFSSIALAWSAGRTCYGGCYTYNAENYYYDNPGSPRLVHYYFYAEVYKPKDEVGEICAWAQLWIDSYYLGSCQACLASDDDGTDYSPISGYRWFVNQARFELCFESSGVEWPTCAQKSYCYIY